MLAPKETRELFLRCFAIDRGSELADDEKEKLRREIDSDVRFYTQEEKETQTQIELWEHQLGAEIPTNPDVLLLGPAEDQRTPSKDPTSYSSDPSLPF